MRTKRKSKRVTNVHKTTDAGHELIFPSMRAASAATGIPFGAFKAWKDANIPGFERSGRVHLRDVLKVAFAKGSPSELVLPEGVRSWRDVLLKAQAARQNLRLDQERGALIRRAWVTERFALYGADLKQIRVQSEAEDPMAFAAALGDPAKCRAVLRGVWDRILSAVSNCANRLVEDDSRSI